MSDRTSKSAFMDASAAASRSSVSMTGAALASVARDRWRRSPGHR